MPRSTDAAASVEARRRWRRRRRACSTTCALRSTTTSTPRGALGRNRRGGGARARSATRRRCWASISDAIVATVMARSRHARRRRQVPSHVDVLDHDGRPTVRNSVKAERAGKVQPACVASSRPSSNGCGTSTCEGFDRLPAEGPAILVPEPRQLPRQRVPDAQRAAQHQLRRQGRVHGFVEDEVPLSGDGDDPHRPRRWQQEPGRARHRRARPAPRRAVRHLPRGHPQPRRLPVQGPYGRGPAGDEGRLPDLPGRRRRHAARSSRPTRSCRSCASRARSRSAADQGRALPQPRPTSTSCCARSPTS